MAPDALRMLARQLRHDPNPDAIEDAACALEALAIGQERQARGPYGEQRRTVAGLHAGAVRVLGERIEDAGNTSLSLSPGELRFVLAAVRMGGERAGQEEAIIREAGGMTEADEQAAVRSLYEDIEKKILAADPGGNAGP